MFNISTIADAFIPLIAWRKDSDPAITQNPMGDLLTGSSGLCYNDAHPLLTNQNIRSIADVFADYTFSAWSGATTYAKGDIVTDSGNYYVSVVAGNLNHAVTLPAYWRQTTPYNEWLRNKTLSGISACLSDWFTLKSDFKTAGNLLKRNQVLDPPGIKLTLANPAKRYAGWYVVPSPLIDIAVFIDRLCVHFDGGPSVTVGLYRNGADTPILTKAITGDGTDNPRWVEVNWELERGNFYYVAYDSDTLEPYNSIANYDRSNWPGYRFPGCYPFAEVGSFVHDGPGETGWSDVTNDVANQNNYGLNLALSARCDYTQLLVDQKSLFAQAIYRRVAIGMLRELAFNARARINRNEDNIPPINTLLYEIDGDSQGRAGGLNKEYNQHLRSVAFDTKAMSAHCLTCRHTSIRIGAT